MKMDTLQEDRTGSDFEQISLHLDQFDYDLPSRSIAQFPMNKRDECRLLYVQRKSDKLDHYYFRDIISLLRKGDRLVFNDTRVIPARLYGRKENGLLIEFLFVEKIDQLNWIALVGPARRLRIGSMVQVEGSPGCFLKIMQILPNGDRVVQLVGDGVESIEQLMEKYGHIPLPHYIERDENQGDRECYQTVYARKNGAVAAPTAGLHFTSELFQKLSLAGIDTSFLTLHVGVGTFRPVKETDPRKHVMHEERYELSAQTVEQIKTTRERGGRIIAVGTTVVRVLEHCAKDGTLQPGIGKTRLMILPPYDFQIVDGLITNFHLPKSTLLMLVCAFAGQQKIMDAYRVAVKDCYRFYSYGDAMLIL